MKNKPRLLYIVEAMGGGVFTYIVDLSNELVNKYDVFIAYAIRPQTPSNYTRYFDKRIHLIEVKNFVRTVNVIKDLGAFFEIKAIGKRIKPDIIHLHSSKAGVLGRWAFNGRKMPMYYTPHGYSFLMSDCGNVKRTIYKIIEIISAKRRCTTISCSEGEHNETLKFTKRAMYINNGINIKQLQTMINQIRVDKKEDNSGQHPFTVFTLGRICYQKNPMMFNEIAMALPSIRFLWIGEGELHNQLTASNIEVTGWMDRDKALKKIWSTDMFILTSLWEGLPISLLEAMYMKKICVVSDVIGNRNVIHNEQNGYVCSSLEMYVQAIKKCWKGYNLDIEEMAVNAYKDILKQYNSEVMAEKYCMVYSVMRLTE